MTLLLDTNTCIHYLNGTSSTVSRKMCETPVEDIRLCVVSVSELYYGAFKSQNSAKNISRIESFLEGLLILPFDHSCMSLYGTIRAQVEREGRPIGGNDLFIAAIALANRCALVTDNTREFSRVNGLVLDNWIRGGEGELT